MRDCKQASGTARKIILDNELVTDLVLVANFGFTLYICEDAEHDLLRYFWVNKGNPVTYNNILKTRFLDKWFFLPDRTR